MQTTGVLGTALAALVAQQGVYASPVATQGAIASSVGLPPDMVKFPEPVKSLPFLSPSIEAQAPYQPPGLYAEHGPDLVTGEGGNSVVGRGERALGAKRAHPRRDTTATAVAAAATGDSGIDGLTWEQFFKGVQHLPDECPPNVMCARSPKGGIPGEIISIFGNILGGLTGGDEDSASSKRSPKGGIPGEIISIVGNLLGGLTGGDDESASSKRSPKGGIPGEIISIFGNILGGLTGGDDDSASSKRSPKGGIPGDIISIFGDILGGLDGSGDASASASAPASTSG